MTNIPFGYRREGKRLVIDPLEGSIRKQVYTLFIQHGRKKAVARVLNEMGFKACLRI